MKLYPGNIVNVGLAYIGAGQYGDDKHIGEYTVKKMMGDDNVYLIKGRTHDLSLPWDVIIHISRITKLS